MYSGTISSGISGIAPPESISAVRPKFSRGEPDVEVRTQGPGNVLAEEGAERRPRDAPDDLADEKGPGLGRDSRIPPLESTTALAVPARR